MCNTSHTSPCCWKTLSTSLKSRFFYVFPTFFGQKTPKKRYIFFCFFLSHVALQQPSLTPQQAFKWNGSWYRGENVDHVPHGMCRCGTYGGYRIGEYSHGKLNGHRTGFNPNGTIFSESDFIDDKLHGHRTEFNEDGSIFSEADYIHGVLQ